MSGQLICGKTEITNSVQAVRVNADGHLLTSGGGGSGGTQYDVGTALPSDATGTVALVKDAVGNAGAMELTAGGALRTSTAGITVGNDDSLSSCQQVLVYGRKDATPSGLRAIEVDFEGQVFVRNQNITSGNSATETSLQSVLVYGRDSGGTLDALKTDQQGHLEVVADYETQTTSIFSGSQVITSGSSYTFPTGYLKNGSSEISIYISSSTTPIVDISYTVTLTYSDDDLTYYSDGMAIGVPVSGIANAVAHFNLVPDKYVKITIENSGTSSLTITSVKGNKINGI